MTSYSLEDIRKAYQTSAGVEFYSTDLMAKLIRPISFYFAWLFVRIGLSANQITYISWVFVLVGCFSYVFVSPSLRWIPLASVLIWALLDYVDGSIARVTRTLSRYGDFIDVVGAYFFLAFLPVCMGVGLYRFPEHSLGSFLGGIGLEELADPALALTLGAFASLANILVRLIIMRMNVTFDLDARQAEAMPGKSRGVAVVVSIIESATSPRGLYFPILILATVFGKLEWFLGIYFVIYSGALVAYTTWYTISLRSC
jgi:hypothetical protein